MKMSNNEDAAIEGSSGYEPPALMVPPTPPVATNDVGDDTVVVSPPPPPTPVEERTPSTTPAPPLEAITTAQEDGNDEPDNNAKEESKGNNLFAGLSLASSEEPATSKEETAVSEENNNNNESEKYLPNNTNNNNSPQSRASTPVHSNASPPPTPIPGMSKAKGSPLVVRPTAAVANSSVVVPIVPSLNNSASPAKLPKQQVTTNTTNATNKSTTTTTKKKHIILSPIPSTKVSSPDTALRLLRKFYTKSSPSIPQRYGGTRPSSWFGWVFGSSAENAPTSSSSEGGLNDEYDLAVYKDFVMALDVHNTEDITTTEESSSTTTTTTTSNADDTTDEDVIIVESILGHKGDSPSKARKSLAAFITLLSTWCTSSAENAALINEMELTGQSTSGIVGQEVVSPELLALGIDIANGLVAHGCFDDLYFKLGSSSENEKSDMNGTTTGGEDTSPSSSLEGGEAEGEEEEVGAPSLIKRGVNMLVESICIADLSSECTELSALKFLLTTGCRMASSTSATTNNVSSNGISSPSSSTLSTPITEPMLRGTHLLQTIRVCSQIYLHTDVESNKTTAKAALQQLVVSVFVRLDRSIERGKLEQRINNTQATGLASSSSSSGEEVNRIRANSSSSATGASPVITFPTQDHRDAYLVLRSLCKLSMQTNMNVVKPPPIVMKEGPGTSNKVEGEGGDAAPSSASPPPPPAPVPPTPLQQPDGTSYDPALESRILALELLLHILRHSSAPCLLNAGPQFQYAIRQYLCTSLLKNTTSLDTTMVELSLRLFVPLIQNFRSLLKTEIEAFVTNVFFVILDSKNSTIQHKLLVVTLFEEICSNATTLAEIFLNYDCDLSAVDLFGRIVNTLGKVARVGLTDAEGVGMSGAASSSLQFVAGAGALRAEMTRLDHRELRLAAMKAMRQVLASLHSSIVTPVNKNGSNNNGDISLDEASLQLNGDYKKSIDEAEAVINEVEKEETATSNDEGDGTSSTPKKTLVEMYDSKKKRREEESQAALKFAQKPTAGLKYAAECGHLDLSDPTDVARYLLQNKDILDKTQIGEYLGREKEWQDGFALKVLRAYGDALDFKSMKFDDSIRYYLSGFRLPGEAQKIDRIMEVFAARYTDQNPTVFPTADSAFILAFSIIMLNTDLHNPAIKEDRKMTIQSFQRMNSGVCDGGDFPDEMLEEIFNRIKADPISLKEDDDARDSAGIGKGGASTSTSALSSASDFFFGSHYVEQDRSRELNYQKEGDQIIRDTESMLRRRRKASKQQHGTSFARGASTGSGGSGGNKKSLRDNLKKHASVKFVGTADSGLRDEYVTPMFDVAWGPALAVFSTAIESANGTDGILASIATDEEMDHAVDNAALAIEVSLNGFQLAICIAGLCGNNTARDAYVRALYHFTLLGSSRLLADRHIQCVQSLLRLGRDDGELLGVTWEHIFRAMTEIYRLHQVWEGMARSERKEIKARERAARKAEREAAAVDDGKADNSADDEESEASSSSEMSDYNDVHLEDEMDKRMIDEANARFVHATIPLDLVDSIFERSTTLSRRSLKDFVYQLCRVSRMEISGYGGHVGSNANDIDLTNDHYMKHHTLASNGRNGSSGAGVGSTQPAIYSLEKLVEVTHFNMESRPRLIFADIWGTISMHLTSTALHEEAAVALFAVDALRQLSLQFLNREELGVFEFQRRFLKSLETIMSRSTHFEVKELLLSSVEQLISIYGFGDKDESNKHQGTLRSGWRSVLVCLGTAGLDKNDSIALHGFKLLSEQIDQCMSVTKDSLGGDDKQPDSLLSEYFVDLVNTLLLFISGPRQDLSSKSIDKLVQLSDILAEGKVPLSSTRRKAPSSPVTLPGGDVEATGNELELWWPMLLGLSQTMGDPRPEVRVKGLGTLFNIINKHFIPTSSNDAKGRSDDSSPQHGDLQTLQLIFRGILVPALEFEEIDGNSTSGFAPELLPPKFVHFITVPAVPDLSGEGKGKPEWINTTFEHLMDGCISICLRSLEAFNSDSLVEEVLAMLNSCLLSDSGHLAVKGLRRLQQFVSKDMELKNITDDTWATVSHMLFRVLSIRGLPPSSIPEVEGATEEQKEEMKQDHIETMNEFIREQRFFSNRRYIGCNAAMVIGSLLTDESIVESMGIHWYIFLTTGLGKGIRDWERAADIMDSKTPRPDAMPSPPHYLENVLYARRWMTKFLLSLLKQRDVATLESAPCQHVLKDETDSLLRAFLAKESNESTSSVEMRNVSKMASDILECFNSLDDDKISLMKWLSPLLSVCIQTNDTTIRTSVQILLTRMLKEANQQGGASANGNASGS